MQTITISKRYNLKYSLKDLPHYQITECKNVINMKTGRILKRSVNCSSVGYWIGKKFIPLKKLNEYCEKLIDIHTPF